MHYYILIIPSIVLYYMVFLNICKYRFSIIRTVISASGTFVLFLSTHFLPEMNMDIMGNIAITGGLFVLAHSKTKNKILSGYFAIFTSVTTIVGGSIAGTIVNNAFNVYTEDVRASLFLYLITLAIAFIVCFAISKYIGIRLHRIYVQLSFEIKQKFAVYGFTLSALTFILSHVNLFVYRVVDDRILLSTVNVVLITLVFFIVIIMTAAYSLSQQKQMEAEYNSKIQEELEDHTRQLEDAYDEMRRFRHDHLNMLHALMGYVDDSKGLREYLNENVSETKKALDGLDKLMPQLKFIRIRELRGLLSVRLAQAQINGIDVRLDITNPVEDIHISKTDLCRMTGIIIDNAIEELLSQDYQQKFLKFGILIEDNDVLIICSNPCKTVPVIEKLFEKGYSSKGRGRGLGLYNLKRICEEHKNLMVSVNTEDDEFNIIVTVRQVQK